MLKRFAVRNYRGFCEKLVWDLSQAGNYQFNTHAIKDGIIKNGVIYGTNGSGKSNLGMAIMDITQHLGREPDSFEYYENYIYAGADENDCVEFSYAFRFGLRELLYEYAKDKSGKLIAERLLVDGELDLELKEDKTVFLRYDITNEAKKRLEETGDHSISLINYVTAGIPLAAEHYLYDLKKFVEGMKYHNTIHNQKILLESPRLLDRFLIRKGLVEEYKMLLNRMTGQDINFETLEGDEVLYCRVGNRLVRWIEIASEGTKAFTLQYANIHTLLEKKRTFVLFDEFDAFYHYELSYSICEWVFNMENTQVFMTTHHTPIMTNDLLRPDCYFVIDGKEIKPINKMTKQELRQAHNLEKMYRGNAFSL